MESIHEEGGTGLRSKDTVFTLPGKTGGHMTQLQGRSVVRGNTDSLPTASYFTWEKMMST